jgi:hypothetical protein
VELRYHPLMSYRSVSNWPPVWVWIAGQKRELPKGEIGILKEVLPSKLSPGSKLFLMVEHNGGEYMGCLMFDDGVFCRQLEKLLPRYYNQTISQIGGIDFSHTL